MKTQFKKFLPLALALTVLLLNLSVTLGVRAQTWSTNSPLQTARWAHTATLLTNGTVLIAGGILYNTNGSFADTNACELYNPRTGTSALTGPMQYGRNSHTATLLPNGQVLVAGGPSSTSEVYDPASGSWIGFTSMNNAREYHTATLLTNGLVLVAGGYDAFGGGDLSSAELYYPNSGTWTNTASMPYAADTFAAVLLTNGMVLVCGGSDNGSAVTNAALYNPLTQTWTNTASMNEPRAGHTATLLPDGTVLVEGGNGGNTVEIYDPVAANWTYVASMNDGRSYPQAVLLPNGQVMVMGDGNAHVELYDRRNDQWFYSASQIVPGYLQTATLLPGGQVVVTGGSGTQYNGPALATVQTFTDNSPLIGHILVAHYPFDTSSTNPLDPGFLADTSGNGYNLPGPSSSGSTYPLVTTNRVAGGTAVKFDGTNYYELPKGLLTTIAGTYSLSLWLQTTQVSGSDSDSAPSDPGIVWAGGTSVNYYDSEPMVLTGSKLGFYTGDDGSTLHSVTSINLGNFTHIVITRDQPTGVKKIYINGVLDATATGGTNFLTDSSSLELGISYYNGGVAGAIDDVQFYNGLLTAGEVASLHANPGSVIPDLPFLPLGSVLGDTNLTWTTSGNALWFGQNHSSHDGNGAAQSGSLGGNQSCVLQTTVTGPGILSFWWQTLCANDGFDLEFDIDGTPQASLLNQTSWIQKSTPIGAGTHALTWIARSQSGSSPSDAGYVDQVTFTPPPPTPSPGMWTLTGSLSNSLYLHTATLLPSGKVFVVGGNDNSGNATAAAQLYDPATGTWIGTNAMGHARYAHTATLLTNGLVLVVGGTTNQYDSTTASLVPTVELFNPTNSTWTTTGPLNFPRFHHTATLLANGKVLVTGGMNADTYPVTVLNSSELYDPATGLWTTNGPLHEARYNHTATLLPSGQVLVAGGEVTNYFLVTGTAELYDPVAGTWTATGSMPNPVANHTASLLPNGQVLAAGGDIDIGSIGGISLVPVPFAELYDPATGLWTTTTSMHFVHDYHTAILLTNGVVLIAGGGAQFGSTTNCAELYEPVAQTWTAAATMNTPRQYHTATLLPNGQVLAAGGRGNSGLLASAELYNSISLAPIILINPAKPPGGSFQFSFLNTAGSTNTVFTTTNLALAFSNWTVLGTATEVSAGHFQFADPQATNGPQRFYRVRSP